MLTSPFAPRLAIALLAVGVAVEAQAAGKPKLQSIRPKVQCSTMVGYTVPAARIALPTHGATVKVAELKASSGQVGAPDYLPEYCSMTGVIHPVDPSAPDINFGVNIPTAWNQMSWHIGGQGNNGIIPVYLGAVLRYGQAGFRAGSPLNATYPPDAPTPTGQGYATFGGDSGHDLGHVEGAGNPAAPNPPAAPGAGRAGAAGRGGAATPAANPATQAIAWEMNDEAWTNYAYAGLKKTHDVAMQIMKAMYGTESRVTYFGGQSNGGRDSLNVVNMFPDDYDGVLAAGPLTFWTGWGIESSLRVKRQLAPGAWVPPSKAAAIRDETLRLCDGLDGLVDSVIQNYAACNRLLDPTITPNPLANIRCPGGTDAGNQCLSDAQMETVNSFHAPIKYGYALANGETEWPGEPTGAEGPQGWLLSQTQPTANSVPGFNAFFRGGLRMKEFNAITLDLAAHREQVLTSSKLMDNRIDWSKFLAKGGKLIYYTGGRLPDQRACAVSRL